MAGLVHVLPVEVHAGFEAQRVAGAQTAGHHAGGFQGAPQRHQVVMRQDQLEAIFAGVAGAPHEHPVIPGGVEGFQGRNRVTQRRRQVRQGQRAGGGPLHGEDAQVITPLHGHGAAGAVLLQPGDILVGGAGIDHQSIGLVAGAVDDKVVDDAAVFAQHGRVQGASHDGELGDVVGQQMAQKIGGIGAGHIDRGHVGHVEHAGGPAHGMMLFKLRGVLDGHVPPGKIDQARVQTLVLGVQGGGFQHQAASSRK